MLPVSFSSRLRLEVAPIILLVCACPSTDTEAEKVAASGAEAKADKTPSDDASGAEGEQTAPAGLGEHIDAEKAGPLTAEEERLIAANPDDLTKEERRKRAFALRKKIMQDPDSEQAQMILQGAEALRRGEVSPTPADGPTSSDDHDPKNGLVFHPPTPAGEKKAEGLQK